MKLAALCTLLFACGGSPGLGTYRVEARHAVVAKAAPALRDLAQPPELEPDRPESVPRVESAKLANDVPVYVLTRHDMPTVSFAILTEPSARGWQAVDARFTEAAECAVYDHDDGRSGKALVYWDSRHSMDTGAVGTILSASYLGTVGPSALDLWLDFLSDIRLDGEAFECAEGGLAARRLADHDSAVLGRRALAANVYVGEHPLGPWSIADAERLPAERAKQRAHEAFRPGRSAIVAVGDISLREVVAVAEKRWGSRPRVAGAEPAFEPALPPSQPFVVKDVPTHNGVYVTFGAVGVSSQSPQFAAQRLALTLLEDELYHRLRIQRGEVYTLAGDHQLSRNPSLSSFGVHVPVGRVQATLDEMAQVLARRLTEPASEPYLLRLKRSARQHYGLSALDSNDTAAHWLASVWGAGLDPTKLAQVASAVDGVDAGAVQAYLQAYWAPSRVTYAVVGPLGDAKQTLHDPD